MDTDAQAREILFLKDRVYQLEMQLLILQKHLHKKGKKPRYEVRERLLILWHMEAFRIPRRKVSRYFGIARSTLYRWLHKIEDQKPSGTPANKTPTEIAALVWEITKANLSWGRIRIAHQLQLLGIFLSASTVRNILQSPRPRNTPVAPKHIISDQAGIFTGDVFAELPDSWNIKPRLGAVGKHGSIAVTERVIETSKNEWLKRVSFIGGFDHLVTLCSEFEDWYNTWRPHMTLDGFRPDDVYYDRKPRKPQRDSKTVPRNIQQHVFRETRVAGYRLKDVA